MSNIPVKRIDIIANKYTSLLYIVCLPSFINQDAHETFVYKNISANMPLDHVKFNRSRVTQTSRTKGE